MIWKIEKNTQWLFGCCKWENVSCEAQVEKFGLIDFLMVLEFTDFIGIYGGKTIQCLPRKIISFLNSKQKTKNRFTSNRYIIICSRT